MIVYLQVYLQNYLQALQYKAILILKTLDRYSDNQTQVDFLFRIRAQFY